MSDKTAVRCCTAILRDARSTLGPCAGGRPSSGPLPLRWCFGPDRPSIRIACPRTDVVPASIHLRYPPTGMAVYRLAECGAISVTPTPVFVAPNKSDHLLAASNSVSPLTGTRAATVRLLGESRHAIAGGYVEQKRWGSSLLASTTMTAPARIARQSRDHRGGEATVEYEFSARPSQAAAVATAPRSWTGLVARPIAMPPLGFRQADKPQGSR